MFLLLLAAFYFIRIGLQAPFCQIFLSVVRNLNINKGVDNDFICDYSSSLSVDNDHMEAENYLKKVMMTSKLTIFHLMVSQITIQKHQMLRVD